MEDWMINKDVKPRPYEKIIKEDGRNIQNEDTKVPIKR